LTSILRQSNLKYKHWASYHSNHWLVCTPNQYGRLTSQNKTKQPHRLGRISCIFSLSFIPNFCIGNLMPLLNCLCSKLTFLRLLMVAISYVSLFANSWICTNLKMHANNMGDVENKLLLIGVIDTLRLIQFYLYIRLLVYQTLLTINNAM